MLKNSILDKATNITMELYQGESDSVIFLKDSTGIIGRKYYTRRIHKYGSETDFSNLKTELLTYGYQHGLLPLWEHIVSGTKQEKK